MNADKRFEETLIDAEEGEIQTMCDVLDRIEKKGMKIGQERGMKIGQERGMKIGQERGMKIGQEKGMKLGESRLASLISKLFSLGRTMDAERAAIDPKYREELYKEFGIV